MEGTPAPIDCIATLQGKNSERFADLDSIRKITIEQSEAFFAHGGHEVQRPINVIGAQMSTRYIATVRPVC